MNKSLSAVGVALSIASSALYAADINTNEAEELQKEETPWFEAGVDLDLFSAYVWRSAVCNDELVFQPGVWFDFTRFEPFWIGGYVWQNWDMTGARRPIPRAMNETDFNVHIGATLWESEDENYSLELEVGNDFFTYRRFREEDEEGNRSDACPNSYEFYVKATFNTPYVNIYGQYSQAYEPVIAPYFELGLNREDNLGELFDSESDILNRFTVAADWNLSFASGKYFTNYLYGTVPDQYIPGELDEEGEMTEGELTERDMSGGVGGTTVKATCFYQVCDNFKVGVLIAYTALLSRDARDAMEYAECGAMYRQLVWGGLQAKFEF